MDMVENVPNINEIDVILTTIADAEYRAKEKLWSKTSFGKQQ